MSVNNTCRRLKVIDTSNDELVVVELEVGDGSGVLCVVDDCGLVTVELPGNVGTLNVMVVLFVSVSLVGKMVVDNVVLAVQEVGRVV